MNPGELLWPRARRARSAGSGYLVASFDERWGRPGPRQRSVRGASASRTRANAISPARRSTEIAILPFTSRRAPEPWGRGPESVRSSAIAWRERRRSHRPSHAACDELGDGAAGVLADEKHDLRIIGRLGHADASSDALDLDLDRFVVLEDLAEERIHLADRIAFLEPGSHLRDVGSDSVGQCRVVAPRDRPDAAGDVVDPPLDPLMADEEVVNDAEVAHRLRVHPPAHHPAGH